MDCAGGLFRSLGDDVDDTSHRISPVQGGSPAFHHFDPFDHADPRKGIGVESGFPIGGAHAVVDPAAIHHHDHPVVPIQDHPPLKSRAAGIQDPCPRHILQGIRYGTITPVRDLLAGDHGHIRRRIHLLVLQPVGRDHNFLGRFFCLFLFCGPHHRRTAGQYGRQYGGSQFLIPHFFHPMTSLLFHRIVLY